MRVVLRITDINPEPWTAPDVNIAYGKNRRPYPQVSTGSIQRAYQAGIRESVLEAYPKIEMFPDDAKLCLRIWVWRRLDEYQTVKGKDQSRHAADMTNIQKATEDALQGILYRNDTQCKVVQTIEMEQDHTTSMQLLVVVDDHDRESLRMMAEAYLLSLDDIVTPEMPGNVTLWRADSWVTRP